MKKKYFYIAIIAYTIIIYILISFFIKNLYFNKSNDLNNETKKISYNENMYSINSRQLNNYNINVDFNPESKTIKVNQTTSFVNNSDDLLYDIYFNLYPNAFKDKKTTPFSLNSFDSPYPNGFNEGYINILSVKVNNKDIDFKLLFDETILKIELEKSLTKDEKIEIYFEYTVKLPNLNSRFGYGKDTYNFGNWYPVLCVYDRNWLIYPYSNFGDPFYTTTSNYRVSITTPKDYIIASTGNIINKEVNKDKIYWKVRADMVRDFAWVASKHFKVKERTIDGIKIKIYYLNNNKKIIEKALKYAINSIEIFNNLFGRYPYEQFSIVSTNINGGMEYPNIVFINEKFYNEYFIERLERIIAHETAHQWWYSVVGNNQIEEAWLDEGLATFSEYLYVKNIYGKERSKKYYETFIENYYYSRKNFINGRELIIRNLKEFNNKTEYYSLVYKKSAMFLYDLEKKFGNEKIINILKRYYEEYQYKVATSVDFINICEEVINDDISNNFDKWFFKE